MGVKSPLACSLSESLQLPFQAHLFFAASVASVVAIVLPPLQLAPSLLLYTFQDTLMDVVLLCFLLLDSLPVLLCFLGGGGVGCLVWVGGVWAGGEG